MSAKTLSACLGCFSCRAFLSDEFRIRIPLTDTGNVPTQEIAEIFESSAARVILNEMRQEVDVPMQRHLLCRNKTQAGDEFNDSLCLNEPENMRYVLDPRTDCYGLYSNRDYFGRLIEAAFYRALV